MQTGPLIAFIRDRIAETRSAAVLAAHDAGKRWYANGQLYSTRDDHSGPIAVGDWSGDLGLIADHAARHDPEAVIARMDAYTAILDAVARYKDPHPGEPCTNVDAPWGECSRHVETAGRIAPDVLPLIAWEWSGHRSYRREWTPVQFATVVSVQVDFGKRLKPSGRTILWPEYEQDGTAVVTVETATGGSQRYYLPDAGAFTARVNEYGAGVLENLARAARELGRPLRGRE